MHVRRTLAALLVAPALLVAACGGGSSVADPPVSTGPTSTAPTTQPPARETARHFIQRWADAEKRMENTGDTEPYLLMSRHCLACTQLAADIRSYYAAGGFVRWSGWHIQSIGRDGTRGHAQVYAVKVNSGQTAFRKSADAPTRHLAGGPATHQLTIKWIAGSWLMLEKAQLAS